MTHHPHVHMIVPGGGISLDGTTLDVVPAGLLPAGAGALEAVPPAVAGEAARRPQGRPAAVLRRACAARRRKAFAAYLAPLREIEWCVYAKRPFGGPEAVLAYLSRYTHRVAISNRRLIAADDNGVTFKYKDYRDRGPRPLQDDDAGDRRVHPPLPDPRAAEGLPSHPPLRAVRQRRPRRQHRAGARAARRCRPPKRARAVQASTDEPSRRAAASMPVLRRPHDHHRDLRARLPAQHQPTPAPAAIRIDTS